MIKNLAFRMVRPTMVLASLLAFYSLAHAGEMGRVTFEGKEIILFDDNSWHYAEKSANKETTVQKSNGDCVTLKSKIVPASICLDDKIWKVGNASGDTEFSFNTKTGDLYLLMITESTAIPLKAFEKAVIANAQNAAGLKPVKTVLNERINFQGQEWGHMIYLVDLDGLIIKYDNYFTLFKGEKAGSVQFVFYTTPENYDKVKPNIDTAAAGIALH